MSNKQSGFSIVEGVIAILVMGLLGYIGWTVYNTYTSKPAKVSSQTSSPSNSQPSKESTTVTSATPQGNYLDIKELGIKILLNDTLNDVIYSLRQPQPTDGEEVYITTQSLLNSSPNAKDYCESALGLIYESTTAPTYINSSKPLPVDNKTVFKIGGEYYSYTWASDAGGCDIKSDGTPSDLFLTKLHAFIQAVTTMQPDTYLNIKELGIKLPLSDDIKDLTYTYNNINGANYLHFSTSSIISTDPTCSADKDLLGIYTVYTTEQPNPGGADNQAGTLEADVNGYYIYYHHVEYACGNSTAAPKVSAAIPSLLTAVQGAQAQ